MYEKSCIGCGNEYTTRNYRQKRCRPRCGLATNHSARAARTSANDLTFIGVDGEGVDRPDGRHEYVMLSVGTETLFDGGKQLGLERIFAFLYSQYLVAPEGAFVGFFLGYDFIQWLKLLPESVARSLLTPVGIAARKSQRTSRLNPYPDPVVWEGWEFDILAGRRFRLRPHAHRASRYQFGMCRNRTCDYVFDEGIDETVGEYDHHWILPGAVIGDEITDAGMARLLGSPKVGAKSLRQGWMYICDTGPFWQTSFLNVINPQGWDEPICTDSEYETVVRGKADRGTIAEYGDTSYYDDMRVYNVLENEILARVTSRLNKGFMNEYIPIRIGKAEWYGPGRAAQLWMDMLSAKTRDVGNAEFNRVKDETIPRRNEGTITNADVYMSMPSWAYEAAQATYYGGWFEQFMHGHIGNVYEYDINSAYPAVIANLPCLHTSNVSGHDGEWWQGVGEPADTPGIIYMVNAEIWGSDAYIGVMPYRTAKGHIMRPHHVKGWYWLDEMQASREAGLIDRWNISEYVAYKPCSCPPPFDPKDIGITRMYQLRLDVGKNSPQGKGFKLVYNSAYGKTAQSKGQPKYGNPFYASRITSGCRRQILRAIACHPKKSHAVAMVATDGVYFTSRHEGLHLSPTQLGAWDEQYKEGMTQLMPGVYWDDSTREAVGAGVKPKMKSRGVNASDLARQITNLDRAFDIMSDDIRNGVFSEWPTITFTVGFLMDSAKLALHQNQWGRAGRVQHDTKRSISSDPRSKRSPHPYLDGDIVRTSPYPQGPTVDTVCYPLTFGHDEFTELQHLFEQGQVNRDGVDPLWDWRALINDGVA